MATVVSLGFVLFPLTVPGLDYIDTAPVMFFVGMWSVAHILLLRQNELVERNRRSELQRSAQKLTDINQVLQQENAERQQAEKQLAASLSEKEVLLKEEIYSGGFLEDAPDLVASSHEGYDLKGAVNKPGIYGNSLLTGGHTRENAVFYINRNVTESDINIVDVGPTVMSLMGIEDNNFDGKCVV